MLVEDLCSDACDLEECELRRSLGEFEGELRCSDGSRIGSEGANEDIRVLCARFCVCCRSSGMVIDLEKETRLLEAVDALSGC